MWKEFNPLEIVSVVIGFIVLILFSFTFRILWISFFMIAVSIAFIFGSYIVERVNLQRLGESYYLKPSVLQRVERIFEILLLIFNVLAMILLFWPEWWYVTHTFEGYIIFSLKIGFYLLLFNRNFVKIGRIVARRHVKSNNEN